MMRRPGQLFPCLGPPGSALAQTERLSSQLAGAGIAPTGGQCLREGTTHDAQARSNPYSMPFLSRVHHASKRYLSLHAAAATARWTCLQEATSRASHEAGTTRTCTICTVRCACPSLPKRLRPVLPRHCDVSPDSHRGGFSHGPLDDDTNGASSTVETTRARYYQSSSSLGAGWKPLSPRPRPDSQDHCISAGVLGSSRTYSAFWNPPVTIREAPGERMGQVRSTPYWTDGMC